ncbi:MAG: molybdopterin-dependent oxidoreductase [Dehalococcoidia bacterium]|nr:molybdopterin-dependent oxidoreductase [Dehalococcoidia bacterium]
MDTRQAKCLLCPLGCGVAFRVQNEAVIGPEFCADAGPHSARLCARGLYGAELLTHPQRVANPFLRKEGALRDASWTAAVDTLVSSLKDVVSAHGWESVAVVTDPTRSTADLEVVDLFARRLGVGAVSCAFEPQDRPLVAVEQSAGADAIVEANCVIVFGDVFFSHAVLAKEIIDAKYTARGNSLFVVDPRRSNTAWYASEHVQNRPGAEALVLVGMLKALKASGKLESAPDWLDGIDEKALLAAAGVGADVVARMARSFADAGKAAIVVAPSARGMHDVGLVTQLARLVATLCGGQKDCVLLPSGGNVRGAYAVATNGDWTPVSSLVSGLASGKYRALLNLGADLLCSFPSAALSEAVRGLGLVASLSLFRGPIESASSVLLAGATWLESDGSAVLFDGSATEWNRVGAPSWGCRTLPEVLTLIEESVELPAGRAADRTPPRTSAAAGEASVAARVEAVRTAVSGARDGEFALVALPATGHMGSGAITGWMQWAREMFPGGFCEISVQDAAALGIAKKDLVTVESSTCSLDLVAQITDRLKPGVVAVPGYDPAARALFSWGTEADGWFSTGPGLVRVSRKHQP